MCWRTYKEVLAARERARLITMSQPVTADTLPAEEVLLRGAKEPIQEQSTVLLRAAEERAEFPCRSTAASYYWESHTEREDTDPARATRNQESGDDASNSPIVSVLM